MELSVIRYDLEDAEIVYYPEFYSRRAANSIYEQLLHNTQWQSDQIKIFGKIYSIPRLQAWYGDPGASYSYSNIDLEPNPWTPLLKDIKKKIESYTENEFNSVLLNLYRNGMDSNGWHSDDEVELGRNPFIVSLSFGQNRKFHLKHKTKKLKKSILLEHGSLLVMGGKTQHFWKHQIPKSKKPLEPRINLTFRKIFK